MFENLIMSSMDSAGEAHPAFASMISQITQDEAWILKSITQTEYALISGIDIRERETHSLGFFTLLGRDCGANEARRMQYISNLDRLGILQLDLASNTINEPEYRELEAAIDALHPDTHKALRGGVVRVTAFGEQFLRTCVRVRKTD